MIEILTRLLKISTVTSKVLGFWRISRTSFSLWFCDDSSSLISFGCKEKYAVSLEEAIAEHNNKPHIRIKQKITLADMPIKKGSAAVTVSRHMRGSIEDISKINIFKFGCKDSKKVQKSTRQQDYKFFIIPTYCLVVL